MKTVKQAASYSCWSESIIRAVVRSLRDKSYLSDIANHGVDGGFPGFTYYSDTVAFFRKHRKEITANLLTFADDMGEDPVKMVSSWRCVGPEFKTEVGQVVYGARLTDEHTTVANALAWYAVEEIARAMTDY